MTTVFLTSENKFIPAIKESLTPHFVEELPMGTYIIQFSPKVGFYLEQTDDFKLPEKIYGDTKNLVSRFLTTFQNRPGNTGIQLSGDKGSGKTMTAKATCRMAQKIGIITLMMNDPFTGTDFFKFLHQIKQPAIILIDEFEKMFSKVAPIGDGDAVKANTSAQESLLTLLDGTFSAKKLFLMTCNDVMRVDSHLKDRPGRVFYHVKYKGMEMSAVKEYLEDRLEDKTQIEPFMRYVSMYPNGLSFDMVQAIVEEMNRYKEGILDATKYMSISPVSLKKNYTIDLYYQGKKVPPQLHSKTWYGNPSTVKYPQISIRNDFLKKVGIKMSTVKNAETVIQGVDASFEELRKELDAFSQDIYQKINKIQDEQEEKKGKKVDAKALEYEQLNAMLPAMEPVIFSLEGDLKKVDTETGVYTYIREDGLSLVITPEVIKDTWTDDYRRLETV